MKWLGTLLFILLNSIFILASENDSTRTPLNTPVFCNSISVFAGGGNKNYHGDSFYSLALKYESKSEYTTFAFEVEHLLNTEKGFASCVSGERERFNKNYNTTYFSPTFGLKYKFIETKLGVSLVNQTRGWCENILDGGYAYFWQIDFGALEKLYLSIGSSENFRVSLSDEIAQASITYYFSSEYSNIKLITMNNKGNWGYGLKISKQISDIYLASIEFYSYEEIPLGGTTKSSEVFNIRIGFSYLYNCF